MLDLIGLVGIALYSGVSLVVAVRLLALFRSSRQTPELFVGVAFLTGGFVAGLFTVWLLGTGRQTASSMLFRATVASGCIAYALAAWRIFRRDEVWARALAALLALSSLAYVFVRRYDSAELVLDSRDRDLSHAAVTDPLYWLIFAGIVGSYAWICAEILLEWRRLRKQLAHGLSQDRLLARRLLLWGLGTLAASWVLASFPLAQLVFATTGVVLHLPLIGAVLCLLYTFFVWSAFFPSRALQARLASAPVGSTGG